MIVVNMNLNHTCGYDDAYMLHSAHKRNCECAVRLSLQTTMYDPIRAEGIYHCIVCAFGTEI